MFKREVGKCFVSRRCCAETKHVQGFSTYLHDELNGADKETQELENHVLLLLLHLVETIFATALENLVGGETDAGVGLEHILGDDARTAGSDFFLLLNLQDRSISIDPE